MRQAGVSDDEAVHLREAQRESDRLAETERAVFAAFDARLAAAGIHATRLDSGTLHLPSPDEAGLERVWHAAREAGVVVRALTPVQERFEDVFLQAIAQPQEAAHAAP